MELLADLETEIARLQESALQPRGSPSLIGTWVLWDMKD